MRRQILSATVDIEIRMKEDGTLNNTCWEHAETLEGGKSKEQLFKKQENIFFMGKNQLLSFEHDALDNELLQCLLEFESKIYAKHLS